MKTLLAILTVLLGINTSFAANLADAAVQSFKWDIKNTARGPMMFLDVPYQRNSSSEMDYLTIAVAKETSKTRPAFFSFIVPDNINKASGVFLSFGKGKNLLVQDLVHLPIQTCTSDFCTARIIDGIATNDKTKKVIDVYQDFLNFDCVFITVSYKDGSNKSIMVPLYSFKEQYRKL